MHAERKKMWIDALLSGDFEQARGTFSERVPIEGKDDLVQRDCCLSVLTRIAIENGCEGVRYGDYCDDVTDPTAQVLVPAGGYDEDDDVAEVNEDGSAWVWDVGGQLPRPVAEWIGVNSLNPNLDGTSAITRNDSYCDSFEEIARAIEATP